MNVIINTRSFFFTILIILVSGQSKLAHAAEGLLFTPLLPCRILDTRFGSEAFEGPIGGLSTISIQTNLSDFSAQGGGRTLRFAY